MIECRIATNSEELSGQIEAVPESGFDAYSVMAPLRRYLQENKESAYSLCEINTYLSFCPVPPPAPKIYTDCYIRIQDAKNRFELLIRCSDSSKVVDDVADILLRLAKSNAVWRVSLDHHVKPWLSAGPLIIPR
jgi:hypothetical protein